MSGAMLADERGSDKFHLAIDYLRELRAQKSPTRILHCMGTTEHLTLPGTVPANLAKYTKRNPAPSLLMVTRFGNARFITE